MFRTVFACSGGRRPGLQPQASAFRAPQFVVGVCVVALVHTPRPLCAQEVGAPEVIYHNAKVVTVSESFEIAEAVAIRDGRIVAVGSDSDVRGLASAETRIVDLGGKTMVPGFYDNHIHLGGGRTPRSRRRRICDGCSRRRRRRCPRGSGSSRG